MKDHYSFLAPFYNSLTKVVFGQNLRLAKACFIKDLNEKRILIIGGGDGKDYQDYQKHLKGEYWELSSSMLQKSKSNLSKSGLTFNLGLYKTKPTQLFDEVWLHFVLDTMKDEEIVGLLEEARKSLSPAGRLYLVDFFKAKTPYQHFMTWAMISSFRILVKHKRTNLPDYEELLSRAKWVKSEEKHFLRGWVKSQVWALTIF